MKKENRTIYIADDGKEFVSEKECVEYEKLCNNIKYFVLRSSPDLTATGSFTSTTHVAVYSSGYYHKEIVEQYAFLTIGRLIGEGVMGHGLQPHFVKFRSTRECYLENKGVMRGGSEIKAKQILLSPIKIEGFPEHIDYFEMFKLK